MPTKNKAQMIYFKPDVHTKLMAIAKAEQRSFSQVVNMTIEIALAKMESGRPEIKEEI